MRKTQVRSDTSETGKFEAPKGFHSWGELLRRFGVWTWGYRWMVLRVAVIGCIGGVLMPLPISLFQTHGRTTQFLDRDGGILDEVAVPGARSHRPVTYEEMGHLPELMIALEDHRFRSHPGVDVIGVSRAIVTSAYHGRFISGGSTITQQLIKLAKDRWDRGLFDKVYEMGAALKLELIWSKDEVLEAYLNHCNFGNNLIGPEAAALGYFNKSARDLTLGEAIYLAGLPQSPARYDPWTAPHKALGRYQRAIDRLVKLGVLDERTEKRLRHYPPIAGQHLPPQEAPHFVDALLQLRPGLKGQVATTLDAELQFLATKWVTTHLAKVNRHDLRQAVMVIVENESGAVRALVGSGDPEAVRGSLNGALIRRSAGSTLKPFIYLDALAQRKITAASLLPDTPDAMRQLYPDYDPRNFNGKFMGPVRAREALACSLNVPAVMVTQRLGPRKAFYNLQRWGFEFPRSFDDYGAGFVLGNAEVSPIELATAYCALARGGKVRELNWLPDEVSDEKRVAPQPAVEILNHILSDRQARKKAFGLNSSLNTEFRTAAKTGTSSNFRDAWTAGFNRKYTVVVWVGNFDGRPMDRLLAMRSAAPLWSAAMNALTNRSNALPDTVGGVERAAVCSLSGKLPTDASPGKVEELFLPGTRPKESARVFFSGGKVQLPDEYAVWCASAFNHLDAKTKPESGLRITQPVDRATYRIDRILPRKQQQIEFAANHPARWFVNGEELELGSTGLPLWTLEEGTWELTAKGSQGEAKTTFSVVR